MIKSKNKNNNILLNLLFKSKYMYGEKINKSNNEIFPFIYGIRNNYTIINLENISFFLKRIFKLIKNISQKNEKILIIGNSIDTQFLLNSSFIKNKKNILYISNTFWVNGFITNKINKTMNDKKINFFLNQNKIKLIIFLKSEKNEKYLIQEFYSLKIPVISIVNTNMSLKKITYPIIMNSQNIMSLYTLLFLLRKNI